MVIGLILEGLGLSKVKVRGHREGTGVGIALFSIKVLGVVGVSNKRKALTRLYGGLHVIDNLCTLLFS